MAHNLLPVMDGMDSPGLEKPACCLLNLLVNGKDTAWGKQLLTAFFKTSLVS
jgi:hypothetical protein